MATRFKKPISREIDLPVMEELTKAGTCKVCPHIITFDDVGVSIRKKNSKTVLFAEWRQIYLNRLNSGIFHTQESAEVEREDKRPTVREEPKKKRKPRKSNVAGIDRTQVALEGEPGPNSEPETDSTTLFEELGEWDE